MKTKYQIITTVITTIVASLHWIWYSPIIFIVIFNAETWFFGTKLSGEPALILHFSYGISGFIVGYLVYRQRELHMF